MMEKAIKQRLVGGLVLIAGAALFLPMLLDGSGADLVVPPVPKPPAVPGVEAIQPQLKTEIASADKAVDAAQAEPEFHEVTPSPAATAEETPPDAASLAAAEAPAPVPAVPAKPVQAPVPDKKAEAKAAADKLTAEQARLSAQKAEAEKLAREKAEKERQLRLEADKKAQEAKQKLVQSKPAVVAPAPAKTVAADLPEAWVVQVASLSAREKADELVTRLRGKGYRATVVHQTGMWKVLVGPELRKEVAESVKQRLAADPELKLSGWVQAWKP